MEQLISISHWLTKRTTSIGVEIFEVMTVLLMNAEVFRGALPCRLANSYWRFGRVCCPQLQGLSFRLLGLRYTVGGGSTLLRNVGNFLPVDTAWQPRKWILKKQNHTSADFMTFCRHVLSMWDSLQTDCGTSGLPDIMAAGFVGPRMKWVSHKIRYN
jgi:hypothetical protein